MGRLAQQHSDLHRALAGQSPTAQRAAVERLVAVVLDLAELDAATPMDADVQSLDEQAWDLLDQIEQGTATQDQYAVAFRRARAANAALLLAEPGCDLEDVTYEAVHALPEDVAALPVISG